MFKSFFVTAILGALFMNSQIAAAYDYDWSQAKKISTKAEFYRYVETGRRREQNTFHVVLTNDSILSNAWKTRNINKQDFANIIPCLDVDILHAYMKDERIQLAFRIKEYSGTHVANAYLSRNQQQAWMNLSAEEKRLYNIAVVIVDEANKRLSEREKAEYIHDEIIELLGRNNFEYIDGATAINALIYKKTDCEGFADAFYMLGRMAGLNVGRMFGSINYGETPHIWNTITFSDGRTYFVDVTQDYVESLDKHKYCIVPSQTLKNNSYWCHWEMIPNLQ